MDRHYRWLASAWGLILALLVAAAELTAESSPAHTAGQANAAKSHPAILALPPGTILPFSPPEAALFCDAEDERLDEMSLFEALLAASGVESIDELAARRRRFENWTDRLSLELAGAESPRDYAQLLLKLLHQHALGQYRADGNRLDRLLDDGFYNCASASALFVCLARQFGLDAVAVEVPGHVYCRVKNHAGWIDVETTCATWFDTTDRAIDDLPAPIRAGVARPLSDLQLVAALYYNRGCHLLAEERFTDALHHFHKAHRLDPSSDAIRKNLLATINNWSLALSRRSQFERSVRLLRYGRHLEPEHASFQINYLAVHQQWIDHLHRHRRTAEAQHLAEHLASEQRD